MGPQRKELAAARRPLQADWVTYRSPSHPGGQISSLRGFCNVKEQVGNASSQDLPFLLLCAQNTKRGTERDGSGLGMC